MTGLGVDLLTARWAGLFEKPAGLLLCAAVVTCPIALKMPVGPTAVSVCDVLMAVSAVFFLPAFLHGLPDGWRPLRPALPLIGVALVSALCGGNVLGSAREVVQLALYLGCGAWGGSRMVTRPGGVVKMRAAAGLGFAAAIAGVLFRVVWPDSVISTAFHEAPALPLMSSVLAGVWLGLAPRMRTTSVAVLVALATVPACISFCFPEKSAAPAPVPQLRSEIDQRWLEAYAAVSVVSRFPLLGLGPGNYQTHIGAYYGTLPKDNTMAPDSQVGYAVVAASLGLLGLAAVFYWFALIAEWIADSRPRAYGLAVPLVAAAVAGFFTPLLASRLLAPLALVQGAAWGRRTGHA